MNSYYKEVLDNRHISEDSTTPLYIDYDFIFNGNEYYKAEKNHYKFSYYFTVEELEEIVGLFAKQHLGDDTLNTKDFYSEMYSLIWEAFNLIDDEDDFIKFLETFIEDNYEEISELFKESAYKQFKLAYTDMKDDNKLFSSVD